MVRIAKHSSWGPLRWAWLGARSQTSHYAQDDVGLERQPQRTDRRYGDCFRFRQLFSHSSAAGKRVHPGISVARFTDFQSGLRGGL
jgi:hypothetical protein